MKHLKYRKNNAIKLYDDIIQRKHLVTRHALQALRVTVRQQYKRYRKNHRQLERLAHSVIQDKSQRSMLIDCYENSTVGLTALKLQIQNDLGVKRCPFCGLNKPTTLDHYLPKGLFPEFSVLYWNLIPCCYDCNSIKAEHFLQSGVRMFAHVGADRFPQFPLLQVNLVLRPQLNYEVLPNPDLPAVWHNHIVNLDLCSRYKEQYDSTFENTVECAREAHYYGGLTLAQIQKNLLRDCRAIFRLQGRNDMEGLLKQAIAAHLSAVI